MSANIFTSPLVHFVCLESQSVRNYCKYGFHADLDRLESRRVLNFIRENPAKVWRDPGADRAFLLCIKFEAKEEGLDLLDLLSVEFSSGGNQKTFEGIRDDKVAQVVVDFECHFACKI